MSPLRMIGISCGLICIILALRYMTTYKRRTMPAPWLLSGGVLLGVSLFPDAITFLANIFSIGDVPLGRLVLLSVVAIIIIWFILLYELNKRRQLFIKLDKLNRNLAFERLRFDSELMEKWKDRLHGTVAVIIPAYNEADNLDVVLQRIPEKIEDRRVSVIVVDDGSSDDTFAIAKRCGALVISHPVNLGGGSALNTGYKIIEMTKTVNVVVTMDADGQHLPEEIEILARPVLFGESDFVIGSRMIGNFDRYSSLRIWGVVLFSKLINFLVRTKVTDCSSGFRAFSPRVFETCQLTQLQYHTAELIIEAAKHGFRISEVPIHIKGRLSGESKKGPNFFYAFHFLKSIISAWLR